LSSAVWLELIVILTTGIRTEKAVMIDAPGMDSMEIVPPFRFRGTR
jgi:hypothetical protein